AITFFVLVVAIRRFLAWWYFKSGRSKEDTSVNVLIIVSGRRARYLAAVLGKWSDWGVHVIGFLDPLGVSAGRRKDDRILGDVNQSTEILRQNVVADVNIALPRSLLGDLLGITGGCLVEGRRCCLMAGGGDCERAGRVRPA